MTSKNTVEQAVKTELSREDQIQHVRGLIIEGLSSAVKAEGWKEKASKAAKGAYGMLTDAAIQCGSGEALKAIWEGLKLEIKANVDGIAQKMSARKAKDGTFLIPKSASNAMSDLIDAYASGISLLAVDEKTGEVTDKPKTYNQIKVDVKAARDAKAVATMAAGNPKLGRQHERAEAVAMAATAHRVNVGYLASHEGEALDMAMAEAEAAFISAVEAVSAARVEAERQQAEAEKAEKAEAKAGDKLAEAEAEAKPTPRRRRAAK